MKKIADIKDSINHLKHKYGLAAAILGSTALGGVGGYLFMDSQDRNQSALDSNRPMSNKEKNDGYLMSTLIMVEGCTLKAYTDDIGVWTYGIGNTKTIEGKSVQKGDTLKNNQEAYEVAEFHIKERIDYVFDYIKRELSPEQKAALRSFMYNCGAGTMVQDQKLTELGLAVNDGDDDFVIKEMLKYNKAGGQFMRGLLARRILEAYEYQGFIALEDLQKCPIGGLGHICYDRNMMDVFKVKLSKQYVGRKRGKRIYKVQGTYDDSAIKNRKVAQDFIKICQQPIDGPISEKQANINMGKTIGEFLPSQLQASREQFATRQEASMSLNFMNIYKELKDRMEK